MKCEELMFLNKSDRDKLKIIIKMLLLERSPNFVSASQIASYVNSYRWGLKNEVTSVKISSLLRVELNKNQKHFLDTIEYRKRSRGYVYRITSLEDS